jgi:NPL4 family
LKNSAVVTKLGCDLQALSDFHLLLFLGRMDVLPMRTHMPAILKAVRDRDQELAMQFKRSEVWRTLEQLIATDTTTQRFVNIAN